MQLEQEYEEKQMVLHEKQDLEGLIGTLCDQVRGKHQQAFERTHSLPPGPAQRDRFKGEDSSISLQQKPEASRVSQPSPAPPKCPLAHQFRPCPHSLALPRRPSGVHSQQGSWKDHENKQSRPSQKGQTRSPCLQQLSGREGRQPLL